MLLPPHSLQYASRRPCSQMTGLPIAVLCVSLTRSRNQLVPLIKKEFRSKLDPTTRTLSPEDVTQDFHRHRRAAKAGAPELRPDRLEDLHRRVPVNKKRPPSEVKTSPRDSANLDA
jgi:hypothetical protein